MFRLGGDGRQSVNAYACSLKMQSARSVCLQHGGSLLRAFSYARFFLYFCFDAGNGEYGKDAAVKRPHLDGRRRPVGTVSRHSGKKL